MTDRDAAALALRVTGPSSMPAACASVWSVAPSLAPECGVDARTHRAGQASLRIRGAGRPSCYGGWQVTFANITPRQTYAAEAHCRGHGIDDFIDTAPLLLLWLAEDGKEVDYDYVLPTGSRDGWVQYQARVAAPEAARSAALQCALRWTDAGTLWWTDFSLREAEPAPQQTCRACCVTAKPEGSRSVEDNVAHFCRLLDEAAEHEPDLVCLPECVTSWGLAKASDLDCARPIPGPESDAFAAKAKEHSFVLGLSMNEEIDDFVYNTGVLFGPDGGLIGKYHKVHLAIGEGRRGTSPGAHWPVFDSPCGRVGMTICKDSSIPESARCLAARGAQVLLMPIMGDHRAVEWGGREGRQRFCPDRWLVIQRARAMDNHLYMVVCRNNREGSCIIAPNGDVLAYNDGDRNAITAHIDPHKQWRTGRGGSFRDSVWAERRPGLYGDLHP